MKYKIACAAVVSASLLGLREARGIPPVQTPGAALHYQASCSVIDLNSIDGYVTNLSTDVYRVQGQARFKFRLASSMSHPQILVTTDSAIQPGETARVSRARLAFTLLPGETCLFDVKAAIRKE
ncbi:MAG: hypothetical protein ACHQ2Z_03940 [Elusimicrobiota bacterium]